jgi:NAD(P)H-nitrite reductase large subunit
MKAVIVGSGLAGVTIAESLAKGARHDITLVTAEIHGYYSRPRLSHGMALSDDAAGKIVLKPFAALGGVKVRAEEQAWLIERERKRLVLKSGETLPYDVLVLATGSSARIPPALLPFRPDFLILNSFDDLLTLRRRRAKARLRSEAPRWAVVGGGLIGCEVASDLHKAGDSVTVFHRESRLIELQLTESQSQALHEHFTALGIEVRYRQDLNELPRGFDGVIVATGFAPRVELARDAGLATGRGIVVDEYLRSADPGIYAAGDVAEIGGRLYPFVSPIRSQALWLADHLEGRAAAPWQPPAFSPVIKIHGFKLDPAVKSRLLV